MGRIEEILEQHERMYEARRQEVNGSTNPVDHLKADHTVVGYWPTYTKGYLGFYVDSDEIAVMDSTSLDAGETTEIECETCSLSLDVDDEKGYAYV